MKRVVFLSTIILANALANELDNTETKKYNSGTEIKHANRSLKEKISRFDIEKYNKCDRKKLAQALVCSELISMDILLASLKRVELSKLKPDTISQLLPILISHISQKDGGFLHLLNSLNFEKMQKQDIETLSTVLMAAIPDNNKPLKDQIDNLVLFEIFDNHRTVASGLALKYLKSNIGFIQKIIDSLDEKCMNGIDMLTLGAFLCGYGKFNDEEITSTIKNIDVAQLIMQAKNMLSQRLK